MAFTREQKKSFRRFLRKIDQELCETLAIQKVIDFFSLMIDYKLRDEEFELKAASLFKDQPEKLKNKIVLDALSGMGAIRRAMLEDNLNSEEARLLTTSYFVNRIGMLRKEKKKLEKLETQTALQAEHEELMYEYKNEREKLEQRLKQLQEEQQNIHEVEIQEQKRRREEKKAEEEQVRIERQIEFEEEVEERRERREAIKAQIEELRVQLQKEHEKQTIERKETKMKREADMRERQQRQVAQQDKQALDRMRKKEKDKMLMQMRQQSLLEQQMKQKRDRMLKKQQEELQRKKVQEQLRKKLKSYSQAPAISTSNSTDGGSPAGPMG